LSGYYLWVRLALWDGGMEKSTWESQGKETIPTWAEGARSTRAKKEKCGVIARTPKV